MEPRAILFQGVTMYLSRQYNAHEAIVWMYSELLEDHLPAIDTEEQIYNELKELEDE